MEIIKRSKFKFTFNVSYTKIKSMYLPSDEKYFLYLLYKIMYLKNKNQQ